MVDRPLSRPINLLVIHHSGTPVTTTFESIRAYHTRASKQGGRGWPDVGYHHVVESMGQLRIGRDPGLAGFHALGHNTHSLGLCLVGDNTRPEHQWVAAQVRTLAEYVAWFLTFHPRAMVLGHRDLPGAQTECPGLDVRKLLRERGLSAEEA